jgi:hypothetical protein
VDKISKKEFWEAVAEMEERKQRWEKKHGSIGSLAELYLQLKPNALARGRLTAQRAKKIEHMLAWAYSEYSDTELEQLGDEVGHLSTMSGVDRRIENLLG